MTMWLSGDKAADRLLAERPIALVIGMVLDQQVPFERAFSAPYELQQRLGGTLTAKKVAAVDPAVLLEAFTRYRSLHRFPGAMAERVQRMCQIVVDEWGGKPERIWETASSGEELVQRLKSLPGFGEQKAKIFAALLGKQLACRPKGWREASAPYGEAGTTISVADISSAATLAKVRAHKRESKKAAKQASST
ncbi:MAG TPA: HhH-GPD-type base excision DNA repair protein [Acidimicrobiales bacterium]|jgi:uncharacterized HhH-GPD family protein|nr:HhH-GPD-type base excision DNA repair protein [Acidimicrobiales bacterium]